jgi:hypothetical protein
MMQQYLDLSSVDSQIISLSSYMILAHRYQSNMYCGLLWRFGSLYKHEEQEETYVITKANMLKLDYIQRGRFLVLFTTERKLKSTYQDSGYM